LNSAWHYDAVGRILPVESAIQATYAEVPAGRLYDVERPTAIAASTSARR
jgi:hypothetical protein